MAMARLPSFSLSISQRDLRESQLGVVASPNGSIPSPAMKVHPSTRLCISLIFLSLFSVLRIFAIGKSTARQPTPKTVNFSAMVQHPMPPPTNSFGWESRDELRSSRKTSKVAPKVGSTCRWQPTPPGNTEPLPSLRYRPLIAARMPTAPILTATMQTA